MKKQILLLTGFMASGKTTLGKKMAKEKGCGFVDLDEYIENKVNCSVSDIFKGKGEKFFRELETECFKEILSSCHNELIVASGGGFPLRKENQTLMKEVYTVFVHTPLEEIKKRLVGNEIEKRPLLKDLGALEKLYNERLPIYLETADSLVLA